MILLRKLITPDEILSIAGSTAIEIEGLAFDSRNVKPGFAFFAIVGTKTDGHQFVDVAIQSGAAAIICENLPDCLHENVSYLKVNNAARTLGLAASRFYGLPSEEMKLVGVTGTNGKTTIATLLYRMAIEMGYKAGLISTISYKINGKDFPSTHTTPDQVNLNKLMAQMVDEGCTHCFMEVSSHAVDQNRIAGLDFDGAVFTNITHDHLDYHITFDAYIAAKKAFFDGLKPSAFAITNVDDKNGMVVLQNTRARKLTYSLRSMADYKCKTLESHFDGTLMQIDNQEIWTHFVGKFNAYNLLAVYAASINIGFPVEKVLLVISKLTPVDGRFEVIRSFDGRYAIVDYAHTPDALQNVLATIEDIRTRNEQLICLVGAGGDRDRTKRPIMAKIACQYSDKVILTSDNPRTEDPAAILTDMEAGVDAVSRKKVLTIADRREAIKAAAMFAKSGDIILIAGKGHEDYQEIMGVKHHFDDKEEIKQAFGLTE